MNDMDNYAIGWAIGKARELMRDARESGAGAAGLAALAAMLPAEGSVKPEQAAASAVVGQRPSVQLSFADELFAVDDRADVVARWWQWLRTRYRNADGTRVGVTEAARPTFDRLLAEFGTSEAFERSKCLEVLDGSKRRDGWSLDDADALGLFDGGISCQVCWARAAAANVGASPEVAARVERQTDYCWGRWAFEDGNGKVVWKQGGMA